MNDTPSCTYLSAHWYTFNDPTIWSITVRRTRPNEWICRITYLGDKEPYTKYAPDRRTALAFANMFML